MARTIKPPAPAVNAPAPQGRLWRGQGRSQLIIWGSLGGLSLLLWLTGLEEMLAHALYQPDITSRWGAWAWWLRQWGAAVPGYMAVAALLLMLWPKLWQQRPLLYQSAAVLVLTAVLGAGLLNQVVVQEATDRHRPRETILVGQTAAQLPAELNGNSFPSGHAGIAFALTAPFFVLQRRRPKTAKLILVGGLLAGAIVGLGRMGLGAHYVSDILIAAAISLGTAALAAPFMARIRHIKPWLLAAGIVLALAGMLLGNHFKLTLRAELPQPLRRYNLPCRIEAAPVAGTITPTLVVQLQGYGAPVSNLRLAQTAEGLELKRGIGIFHSLSCTARLHLPMAAAE